MDLTELLELLEDEREAYLARLQHLERRIKTVREAIAVAREYTEGQADAKTLAERYGSLTLKDMLVLWATEHDGRLVTSEAFTALVEAGLFRDYKSASASLHPLLSRHPELFQKKGRGRYQLADQPTSELVLADVDDLSSGWPAARLATAPAVMIDEDPAVDF